MQIKHRFTGAVLWESDHPASREAVTAALKAGADLRRSDLSGCDLRRSNLSWSDLSGCDLRRSDLSWSDLSRSDLSGSNLSWSNLSWSDLRRSDLSGCDLRWSDLRRSDLSGCDLRRSDLSGSNLSWSNLSWSDLSGVKGCWQLHTVITEILLRAAGDSVGRRKIAGLVAISTDWCWKEFLALSDPEKEWALDVLAASAADDDPDVPAVLRKRSKTRPSGLSQENVAL